MADSVDTVQGFYAALGAGDPSAAFARLASDVTWTEAEGFVYGGTYVGPTAVIENVFARLGSEWEGFAAVPESILSAGSQVVAKGWYTGTFTATGRALRARYVHWFTVQDDRITAFEQLVDSALVATCVAG